MINLGKEGKGGVGIGKKQTEAHSCTVCCHKCGCKVHRSSVLADLMVPEQSPYSLLVAVAYASAARRHLMLPCSLMTVSAGSVVSTHLTPVANAHLVNNVVLQCMDIRYCEFVTTFTFCACR